MDTVKPGTECVYNEINSKDCADLFGWSQWCTRCNYGKCEKKPEGTMCFSRSVQVSESNYQDINGYCDSEGKCIENLMSCDPEWRARETCAYNNGGNAGCYSCINYKCVVNVNQECGEGKKCNSEGKCV